MQLFSEMVVSCFQGGSILPSECVQIDAPATFEALAVALQVTVERVSKKSTSSEFRLW